MEGRLYPGLGHLEDGGFGPVQKPLDVGSGEVALGRDPGRAVDELPGQGVILDYTGVVGDMRGGGLGHAQMGQVGPPAHGLQLSGALQVFGQGDHVHGLELLGQVQHGLKDV